MLAVEEFRVRSGFANLIVNPSRFNGQRTPPTPGPCLGATAPLACDGHRADSDACRPPWSERVAVPDGFRQ